MKVKNIAELNELIKREGSQRKAATVLGVAPATIRYWLKANKVTVEVTGTRKAKAFAASVETPNELDFPTLPDDKLPDSDLVELMCNRFERRFKAHRAAHWMPIKVNKDGPIGITWFGDPHVDSNGCNWPLLRRHAEIVRTTDGMYGASIGDHTDNWVGRLSRLYASSDQSRSTALQLAEIFISKMGIKWLLLLRGNHDMWSPGKDDPVTWMQRGGAPMVDWQARIRLVFPTGREAKIWAAHDFKGHSLWNSLHGPQKAAHMKEACDLYVCGHTHNWALHHEESASKSFVYWLARTRGYKFIDEYADLLGHDPQLEGAAIVSVFNPAAKTRAGFLTCFADVEAGADYLTWLRSRV